MYIIKHPGGKTVDHPKMANVADFCKKIAEFLNLRNTVCSISDVIYESLIKTFYVCRT